MYALSNGYLHISGASLKMNENPTQTELSLVCHILSQLYEL